MNFLQRRLMIVTEKRLIVVHFSPPPRLPPHGVITVVDRRWLYCVVCRFQLRWISTIGLDEGVRLPDYKALSLDLGIRCLPRPWA